MSETKAPASQEKLVESCMKWAVDARGLGIDAFISENAHSWKRVTRRTVASRLRDFLGYAAKRKLCAQRLLMSISTPRVYPQEGLPYHASVGKGRRDASHGRKRSRRWRDDEKLMAFLDAI